MTQKDQILAAINNASNWYSQKELMKALGISSPVASTSLSELLEAGEISSLRPPPGEWKRCQAIFGPLSAAPPDGATALNGKRLPPKVKGFRAEARDRSKQPRAKPSIKAHKTAGEPPRWALTSDGAFILMDVGFEITRPAALSLVDFVRMLDAGAA